AQVQQLATAGAADRTGARPRRLVKTVEGDSCDGGVGGSLVYARLGGDGQGDRQRGGGGDGQDCRDPKAYGAGHRGLLCSMRTAVCGSPVVRSRRPGGWDLASPGRKTPARGPGVDQEPESIMMPAGADDGRRRTLTGDAAQVRHGKGSGRSHAELASGRRAMASRTRRGPNVGSGDKLRS